MKSWAIVIPSNRPKQLAKFREAWADLIEDHEAELIVIQDNPLGWEKLPWFVPRETDMIRSAGMIDAYHAKPDYILTLDDDTLPDGDLFSAYEDAFEQGWPLDSYLSVGSLTDSDREMRGFPWRRRGFLAGVQYGGWNGVPDYDAQTQLDGAPMKALFHPVTVPVPHGTALTGSAMNCAWRRELTPVMWQLPVLEDRYKRFGDIWSGLIAKKVLDHCGHVVLINGEASVTHKRASDPKTNDVLEKPGRNPNEHLWAYLSEHVLLNDPSDLLGTYREVTGHVFRYFYELDPPWAEHFLLARDAWLAEFSQH